MERGSRIRVGRRLVGLVLRERMSVHRSKSCAAVLSRNPPRSMVQAHGPVSTAASMRWRRAGPGHVVDGRCGGGAVRGAAGAVGARPGGGCARRRATAGGGPRRDVRGGGDASCSYTRLFEPAVAGLRAAKPATPVHRRLTWPSRGRPRAVWREHVTGRRPGRVVARPCLGLRAHARGRWVGPRVSPPRGVPGRRERAAGPGEGHGGRAELAGRGRATPRFTGCPPPEPAAGTAGRSRTGWESRCARTPRGPSTDGRRGASATGVHAVDQQRASAPTPSRRRCSRANPTRSGSPRRARACTATAPSWTSARPAPTAGWPRTTSASASSTATPGSRGTTASARTRASVPPAQYERGAWEPPDGDHGRIDHGLPAFVPRASTTRSPRRRCAGTCR